MKHLLPAVALMLTAALTSAGAQAPPMDMSWAFRSQAYFWNQGNAAAMAAGRACYQYSLALRRRGYTGPIDCGANAYTLQNSINRLQNSYYNYNRAQMYNSWRRQNAIENTGRAITGQYPIRHCWYYGRWVC